MALDPKIMTGTGPRCVAGDPLFTERYRAIDARDTRFDGQFITAVSSTGIYCRPSCPARTPKAENVSFYLTSAAAHEAGFRACKRCLPEATPGTPAWDLRHDLTARAMRLIEDGVIDREGVAGLAGRLGYTPRHVHRMMVAEVGAGPLALARARRAQSARTLLVGSDLPVTQVAFAAGFGSIRQFNDTIQHVFATHPRALRAKVCPDVSSVEGIGTAAVQIPVPLVIDLPVRQPFDAPGVFQFLAVRAVDGVEQADLSREGLLRYARTLVLPHGPAAIEVLASRVTDNSWQLRVSLELTSLADVAPAVARVRRMLDLDADPAAIDAALSIDPALAPLILRTPGVRVPGAVDPHELVVRAIVGQQISVAAARSHLGRLVAHAGPPYNSAFAGLSRLFPTSVQIIEAVPPPVTDTPLDPHRPLRLPRQAIKAVLTTAHALATGELDVHVGADADAMYTQLVAQPRIGPWTAAYIVMRVLGNPNSWLNADVALIAGAKVVRIIPVDLPKNTGHKMLAEYAITWAPWRSYAVIHLWRAANTTYTTNITTG